MDNNDGAEIWPNTARRDEFFQRLAALIDEFPEISSFLRRAYEASHFDGIDIEPEWAYNPESPTIIQGLVLIVSTTNMEMWEDVMVMDPTRQSQYLTEGLLNAAQRMWAR